MLSRDESKDSKTTEKKMEKNDHKDRFMVESGRGGVYGVQ